MATIVLNASYAEEAAPLIAAFRSHLRSLKDRDVAPDLTEGREEFLGFIEDEFPIYGVMVSGVLAGYMVCKVEGKLVWVEQIFVSQDFRRQGLATELFKEAEDLSASLGGETLFNYVHPNNHDMLAFLRSQGYTVLNLIEVRKPFEGEKLTRTIHVDDEPFDY